MIRGTLFFLLLLNSPSTFSHGDELHSSSDWNWDPFVLLSLFFFSALYLYGFKKIKNKQELTGRAITSANRSLFLAGIFVLLMALVSPIDIWSDELQAWHMIQHMLIIMVAAPLFVLGSPLYILISTTPSFLRSFLNPLYKRLYGHKSGKYLFWQPVLMWGIFAFTLWIWHLPKFYEAALLNKWLHDFQHICFFISSCLFWRILIDPIHRLKLSRILGIVYLFATTLHATLLGVFMSLAPRIWYPFYEGQTVKWNINALEDQQIAGLIMWMPACMIYVLVTAYIFLLWTRD